MLDHIREKSIAYFFHCGIINNNMYYNNYLQIA